MKPSKAFDQRPVHPIFLRNSRSKELLADKGITASKTSISLSEFLDRKLTKSIPQKSMKAKAVEFPYAVRAMTTTPVKKQENPLVNSLPEVCIFKCPVVSRDGDGDLEKPTSGSSNVCTRIDEDEHDTTERKRPKLEESKQLMVGVMSVSGKEKGVTSCSSLVVLGDDPKPKQTRTVELMKKRRPQNLFNHYANGSGWWDSGMEGVDSEEVGIQETWEGMGSASLGGLVWRDIDL